MDGQAQAALAEAGSLLRAHAAALRAGDADALASLAAALRPALAILARHARGGLTAAQRPLLESLIREAAGVHALAQRRAALAQGALDALAVAGGRLVKPASPAPTAAAAACTAGA